MNSEELATVAARACYLSRLSVAETLFDFPDFALFLYLVRHTLYICRLRAARG